MLVRCPPMLLAGHSSACRSRAAHPLATCLRRCCAAAGMRARLLRMLRAAGDAMPRDTACEIASCGSILRSQGIRSPGWRRGRHRPKLVGPPPGVRGRSPCPARHSLRRGSARRAVRRSSPMPSSSVLDAALSRAAAGCARGAARDGARACISDARCRAARRAAAPPTPPPPALQLRCSRRAALQTLSLAAAAGLAGSQSARGAAVAASAASRGRAVAASVSDAEGSEAAFFMPPTRVTAPGRVVALGDLHGDMAQARSPRRAPAACAHAQPRPRGWP